MGRFTLYGQCRIGGRMQLVSIEQVSKKTIKVRRTHKGQPIGRVISRHIKKHAVKSHGINTIRHDYLEA
jgi:hypothetical protein